VEEWDDDVGYSAPARAISDMVKASYECRSILCPREKGTSDTELRGGNRIGFTKSVADQRRTLISIKVVPDCTRYAEVRNGSAWQVNKFPLYSSHVAS
jgi:hypothetical protein